MHPPGASTVLVRYGDVGVKSRPVRRRMERTLRDTLDAMLADRGVRGDVEAASSRLWIHTDPEAVEAATAVAADAFGVVSASATRAVEPTLDAIIAGLEETAIEVYDGGSFAVRARRAGEPDVHPFASTDIERDGGQAIWETVEDRFEPEVDLDDPDRTFFVECRRDRAYLFLEKRPGPGGLPLGSQDPLVALISGGIDSPVAAWQVMKRGSPIVPVYFDFGDFGGADHVARAVEAIRTLSRFAPTVDMRPRLVPAGPVAEVLVDSVGRTRMLTLRRFMLRVAERVATMEGAAGIVTGEALGQKSSQTAANLAVTDPATRLPIHRPLLTMDKHEIVAQSKRIGTYSEATIPAGCNRIAPTRPATHGTLASVEEAEPDLGPFVSEAIEDMELVEW